MSHLLREIKLINERAAYVLQEADLNTDSDIQTLTRDELFELFPEAKYLKLRRTIFDIIHKQPPVEVLLKKMKGFIPSESFRAALTENGVLVDYLQILKDMKTQTNNVQSFLEAHISLLEEFSTNQRDQESASCGPVETHSHQTDGCPGEARGVSPSTSATSEPGELRVDQSDGRQRGAPGEPPSLPTGRTGDHQQGTLKSSSGPSTSATREPVKLPVNKSDGRQQGAPATLYKMVVSGKTFDTHLKLMESVKNHDQIQNQMQLCEGDQDNNITFVFCPISSRVASDVEAAMTGVKDDKPVILVLMHHAREFRHTTSMRTWNDDARVVLHVNVFYHDTVGLLKSDQNNAAVTEIQDKLLERFIQRGRDTSGNAQGVGADHRDADHKGAGNKGAGNWATLYKMVVSGKTYDTHLKLMEKVKNHDQIQNQMQLCEGDQDNKITFVFCPVSSRVASDVAAAMTGVKDNKPVILVLMHHTRESRYTTSTRTWSYDARVVLHVNVFYHDTVGLLKCEQNNAAVTEIQDKLLERFIQRGTDTSGNAQGVGADHKGADHRGTGNNWNIFSQFGFR